MFPLHINGHRLQDLYLSLIKQVNDYSSIKPDMVCILTEAKKKMMMIDEHVKDQATATQNEVAKD